MCPQLWQDVEYCATGRINIKLVGRLLPLVKNEILLQHRIQHKISMDLDKDCAIIIVRSVLRQALGKTTSFSSDFDLFCLLHCTGLISGTLHCNVPLVFFCITGLGDARNQGDSHAITGLTPLLSVHLSIECLY